LGEGSDINSLLGLQGKNAWLCRKVLLGFCGFAPFGAQQVQCFDTPCKDHRCIDKSTFEMYPKPICH